MSTDVTYTCVLDVDRKTVEYLSRLLAAHRRTLSTCKGTRALGPFKQAVLVIRWFLDGIPNQPPPKGHRQQHRPSIVYAYLHEGIDVLAARAPNLEQALALAKKAGLTHLNLGSGRGAHRPGVHPGPQRRRPGAPPACGSGRSGKHKHHGGNIQVLSTPDGWPLWTSGVRPGREHDATCAKAEDDLLPALEEAAAEDDRLTLTDLGYVNLNPALRHPAKKPAGQELTGEQKAYNQLIRGVHGIAEHANPLLKTTFKALRRVSLDPWRIGAITRAALVLLQLEHGRTV